MGRPSTVAKLLAALPEVGRVRHAVGHAGHGSPARDADADLPEGRAENVRPVRRAVHPCTDDRLRRAEPLAAPGDVLAHDPAVRAGEVADRPDAPDEVAV